MRICVRFVLVLLLVLCASVPGIGIGIGTAQEDAPVITDLADVPAPTQAMPEDGYQVLTGGYLELGTVARHAAEPRALDADAIEDELAGLRFRDAYVLDLVLLRDRADANADILAIQETTVYAFTEGSQAESAVATLSRFETDATEAMEPAIPRGTTLEQRVADGWSMRTIFSYHTLTIDVVSVEASGRVDPAEHALVVEATLDQARETVHRDIGSLGDQALRLDHLEGAVAVEQNSETGVHQLYRQRAGETQLAVGELAEAAKEQRPEGLQQSYVASHAYQVSAGEMFISVWVGQFDSEEIAQAITSPQTADPYFTIGDGEPVRSEQGNIVSVAGEWNGEPYSGLIGIIVDGTTVASVSVRTMGNLSPSQAVLDELLAGQLVCLESDTCGDQRIDIDLGTDAMQQATPIDIEPGLLGSPEFGWSLAYDHNEWEINERQYEPGYEFIELQSGDSLITVESVVDHLGEPETCVLNEMRALKEFESHADVRVWNANPDLEPAGLTEGHGWITYRVEPLDDERADQEYVIRIDCFTLTPGESSLVMAHRAPIDTYESEAEKAESFRDGLTIEAPQGTTLDRIGHTRGNTLPNGRCMMILRPWIDPAA